MSLGDILSWAVSAVVVIILFGFAFYIIGLRALPTGMRPTTPVYDRLGREIGQTENPDYRVNPGEDSEEDPSGTSRGNTPTGHKPEG